MSVPSQALSALMAGKGGPPAPAGGMPAGPGGHPPVSAPMSTPQPNTGEKQGAMVQIQMAMDIMERTLPAFGMETEEGKMIHDVLGKMGKIFGGAQRAKSKELVPSEIMNLMSSMPKGAGPAPGGMPPGAGAPPAGGMPPPMPH